MSINKIELDTIKRNADAFSCRLFKLPNTTSWVLRYAGPDEAAYRGKVTEATLKYVLHKKAWFFTDGEGGATVPYYTPNAITTAELLRQFEQLKEALRTINLGKLGALGSTPEDMTPTSDVRTIRVFPVVDGKVQRPGFDMAETVGPNSCVLIPVGHSHIPTPGTVLWSEPKLTRGTMLYGTVVSTHSDGCTMIPDTSSYEEALRVFNAQTVDIGTPDRRRVRIVKRTSTNTAISVSTLLLMLRARIDRALRTLKPVRAGVWLMNENLSSPIYVHVQRFSGFRYEVDVRSPNVKMFLPNVATTFEGGSTPFVPGLTLHEALTFVKHENTKSTPEFEADILDEPPAAYMILADALVSQKMVPFKGTIGVLAAKAFDYLRSAKHSGPTVECLSTVTKVKLMLRSSGVKATLRRLGFAVSFDENNRNDAMFVAKKVRSVGDKAQIAETNFEVLRELMKRTPGVSISELRTMAKRGNQMCLPIRFMVAGSVSPCKWYELQRTYDHKVLLVAAESDFGSRATVGSATRDVGTLSHVIEAHVSTWTGVDINIPRSE